MSVKTIGIVGGGQLGRMLTQAAIALKYSVIAVDPNTNCSAAQAGAEQIQASFYDESAIRILGERCDYITIESEHINTKILELLSKQSKAVNPTPSTVRMIQDKLMQKQFLRKHNVGVADFKAIDSLDDAKTALESFGGKMVLKTRRGGYDGRGNALIESIRELETAIDSFSDQALYAETFVPFRTELAVMVVRDMSGNVTSYPVTETFHKRNICIETHTPAHIPPIETEKATNLALQVAQYLEGAGVFGIEMFLTADGEVLVNEIAPRVHNSGHYTIEACQTSQFEQHIRAITGMSLGKTDLKVPATVMINILGERNGHTTVAGLEAAAAVPGTTVHLYGKSPTKIDRKMGHITTVGSTVAEAQQRARKARKLLSV